MRSPYRSSGSLAHSVAPAEPRYNGGHDAIAHTIHQSHIGWDNSLAPAARIAPGESLEFDVLDAAGGQLSPASTVEDVGRLDFGTDQSGRGTGLHRRRTAGRCAQGDAAGVRALGLGMDGEHPGLRPARRGVQGRRRCTCGNTIRARSRPALFGRWGKVPLKPFTGTIGVAPAEPGKHSIVPPRRVGRQHGRARHRARHRAVTCRSKSPARCSRWATRMRRRATARSAAPPSRAPCASP